MVQQSCGMHLTLASLRGQPILLTHRNLADIESCYAALFTAPQLIVLLRCS
jgi:hypothetical protein